MDKFSNPEQQGFKETNAESKEVPKGRYSVKAKFKKWDGKDCAVNVATLNIQAPVSQEEFSSKVFSEAAGLGLHNFGMDMNSETYPGGHPVTFEITDEAGEVINTFTKKFNGSGYPVK